MKTFVGALITFIVLLALVIANGIFISAIAESILSEVATASNEDAGIEERAAAVKRIEEELSENAFLLSLSVGHDETATLFSYIAEAKYNLGEDEASCFAALEKLERELKRLTTAECFCADGII
ncbi:MAG: hypothetical protein IKN38_06440 [Clostridia bacterium]|nr:hypothetical protein [Clostridia bacterium]